MYKVGDYVVKANTGICVIEEITKRKITEESPEKDYYVLSPLDDKRSRLFVPVSSEAANLRMAMDRTQAMELIRSIPSIKECWIDSDKLREKKYKEAIKSNDPVELVSIIKNLYIRNRERQEQGKKVTAIDDRYFKMAENTLYCELAHALDEDKDDMRRIISSWVEDVL